jgi:type IV secretion system protein VirB6
LQLWVIVIDPSRAPEKEREPMAGLITPMVRVVVIVTVATAFGVAGPNLHTLVTTELSTDINQLFTGDDTTLAQTIDQNLTYTQLAMAAIDTVQVPPGDTESAASKARAQAFATFGTASPPMAAAAMLLLYEVTLALIIGLGPLFIMCLLFDQTKELFRKWLMYGIGTLFSMGMLAFVSSLVLSLTLRVAAALWTANIINGITGMGAEGFTNQSMQQGGIGLLMTVLIISSPPLAAMFFQGTMGNFLTYSQFGQGGAARAAAAQQGMPGAYGGYGGAYAQPTSSTAQSANLGSRSGGDVYGNPGATTRLSGAPASTYADAIRPAPTPPITGGTR